MGGPFDAAAVAYVAAGGQSAAVAAAVALDSSAPLHPYCHHLLRILRTVACRSCTARASPPVWPLFQRSRAERDGLGPVRCPGSTGRILVASTGCWLVFGQSLEDESLGNGLTSDCLL